MTLIILLIAVIICTVSWRRKSAMPNMKVGVLCFIYWLSFAGCIADYIYRYIKYKQIPFAVNAGALIHDGYTGVGIVAVGLIIWLIIVILISKFKNRERQ